MQLWADVWNTNGTARLGAGPVRLISAEVTRRLDGIGRVRAQANGTDARAVALLQNERRIRLFVDDGEALGGVRELGRGVIRRIRAQGTADNWTLIADGLDELDALTRVNTLLGRTYSQQTPAQISANLVSLAAGWSVSASGGLTTDARFDGMSIWRALVYLAEAQGLHVRAGVGASSVEVGAFGALADVRLVGGIGGELGALKLNDDVALVERLTIDKISEAAATRLYPLGAGIGEAMLTLEHSTRTSPYTIQSVTGANGQANYYLQDAAGIAALGVIEKVGKFRQIAPLSNSPTDLQHAANALYDLAAAWLKRYSQRQDVYRVVCRKLKSTVKAGDTIRLTYRGVTERDGVVSDYVDVDADFWVMAVSERVDQDGHSSELTLSSVDRHAIENEQLVVGALEALELDGVSVKPYFNRTAWVYDRLIDPTHAAIVPLRLTNATQKLSRCMVRIKTRPFTATATAAIGGGMSSLETNTTGAHAHNIGATESDAAYSGVYFWRRVAIYDATSSSNLHVLLPVSNETASSSLQTNSAGGHAHHFSVPDHNHALSYGLHQDSATPSNLRLFVDGSDVTDALGGAWAVGGGAVTFEVDITSAILAHPPLQKEHEIKITCGGGRGSAEVSVEVYEVIQSIAV